MTSSIEIESKYDVPAHFVMPLLGPLTPSNGDVTEQDLIATYFDTADLRLLRHQVTLRRRIGGSDAGWHLKLPAWKGAREEIQRPLGQSRSTIPAELVQLVAGWVR